MCIRDRVDSGDAHTEWSYVYFILQQGNKASQDDIRSHIGVDMLDAFAVCTPCAVATATTEMFTKTEEEERCSDM